MNEKPFWVMAFLVFFLNAVVFAAIIYFGYFGLKFISQHGLKPAVERIWHGPMTPPTR